MPILGVCGDSWYAATVNERYVDGILQADPALEFSEGKHFSEILAKKLNYDLFTLARGACSNSAIRLQISEMVKRKVDFIIIGTTSSNRIEYPRFDNKSYIPENGIYNIYYTFHPDQSAKHFDKRKEVIISDTLTNIFGNDYNHAPVRSEIQREAIKNYYLEVFDLKYREQQDAWIIASGIQEIRDAGIPYLLLGHPWLDYANYFQKNSLRDIVYGQHTGLVPWTYTFTGDRRWHTSDKVQVDIAKKLYEYIMGNNLLSVTQNTSSPPEGSVL